MEAKKRRLSIKLTQEDFDTIHRKAEQANKNITDYVLSCCLGKQIVVIPDMAEMLKQLRRIGNNLNQLTVLCNMGRVSATNLNETAQELAAISELLREVLERRRWNT